MRREVTTGQPLDLEAEFAQAFLRKVNLPMFKRVFVAAADQKRELSAISLEDVTEVESIPLRFVIRNEASSGGEVEQAIVTVHRAMKFADLGLRYVVALGPHLPYSWHPLEQREGAAQVPAGTFRQAAQHRRGVPRMGMPVREQPAIEDEDSTYVRSFSGFAPLRALKPTSQEFQNDK